MNLYTEILIKPLYNLLVFLYTTIPGADLGIAIIVLTLLVKLIFYPLNRRSIVSQKALQSLQPKMDDLKEKYKDNREKLGQEMMALYKQEKINPLSSCLPIIIQIPILIAVYQVFIRGINSSGTDLLYPFVTNPGTLHTIAFGFLDLTQKSFVLAIAAGAAQFWQTKMLASKRKTTDSMASAMNMQMQYIFPIMTVVIGASFPAGLTLYWFATTVFSIVQQWLMIRKKEIPQEA